MLPAPRLTRKAGRPPRRDLTDWVPFFDAVDEARRTRTFEALKRLYSRSRRTRERAVINATARALAQELDIPEPWWATRPQFLPAPYFVSGIENLKASALQESPTPFRQNNIFVLGNFLNRV